MNSPDYSMREIERQVMNDMQRRHAEAVQSKICECLHILFPDFTDDQFLDYAPRISLVTCGQYPYELYLDADNAVYGTGTFLFWYSGDTNICVENKDETVHLKITIG